MSYREIQQAIVENGCIDHLIQGASMQPLLNAKRADTVRLCPLPGSIHRSDIVLFLAPDDRMVLHRVRKVCHDRIYTRGDNCLTGEWVMKDRLIAGVLGVTRKGSFLPADSFRFRLFGIFSVLSLPRRKFRSFLGKTVRKIGEKKQKKTASPPSEFDTLIDLVRAAVNEQSAPQIPDNTDYERLFAIAKKHSLDALVFRYLTKEKIPDATYRLWENRQYGVLKRAILFDREFKIISESFQKNGIDYLPLKGIILNQWYPFGVREFSDYDVLVREKDVDAIRAYMVSLGYRHIPSSRVDEYEKAPVFHFEFHKYLLDDDESGERIFSDVWDRAVPDVNVPNEYRFTDEDFFVYQIAHLFHHYKNGGIGLRHLADMYVVKQNVSAHPGFSYDKFNQTLSRYRLAEFYRQISEVTDSLFGSSEKTVSPDFLLFIYRSGTNGLMEYTVQQKVAAEGVSHFFFSRLLPGYAHMKKKYPVLGKVPVLLPLFWLIRIGGFVIDPKKRKAILRGLHHKSVEP